MTPEQLGRELSKEMRGVVVAAGVGADAPARREFRINASAALLTYHGLQGYDHWVRFNTFVEEAMPRWRVKHWCTTLEQCPTTAAFHVHVMLQFTTSVDKTAAAFIFEWPPAECSSHRSLRRRSLPQEAADQY